MDWGSMFCIRPLWSNTVQQQDTLNLNLAQKTGTEWSNNVRIFEGSCKLNFRLRIRPRVLCGISEVDLSTTVLGEKVTLPIGIAPTATQKLAHPDGEQATAKGNTSMHAS